MLRACAFSCCALTATLPLSVYAENVQLVENIVVTGTLTAKSQFDSPVRTEVLQKDDIERIHARSLKDALENVSGVQLTEIHGKSGYQVSLQGLSSDQVLVLQDGLPVSHSTGSSTDVSQFAISSIERIEVVKGASSSQYGSAAMGGVINLISKIPEAGIGIDLQTDAGSYGKQNVKGKTWQAGMTHGKASVEGGIEKWRARLSADVTDDQGFSETPNNWSQQGDANKRQHYAGRIDWLPTTMGHFWLDNSFYQEHSQSRYQRLVPPNKQIPQQKSEDVEKNRLSAGANWRWDEGWRVDVKAVHETYKSRANEFSNFVLTDDRRAEQGLDVATLQLDLPYWLAQQWTLGATYHQETLNQRLGGVSELADGKARRDSQELFAQNDIFIGDNLELLLGVRWQDDSDFGQHGVPKASLLYSINLKQQGEIRLRSSFGQGYRVPNLKERHFLFDHSALGYKVIGNPLLKPERSDSWQLGMDYRWQDKVEADINLFYNDVRDLIQTDEDNAQIVNGISYFSYTNVGHAKTQGLETAMRWRPVTNLALNLAYTYTEAKDLSNRNRLTRRPKHIARLGIDWVLPSQTELSLRHRYQSSEVVDSKTQSTSPAWQRVDFIVNQPLGKGFKALFGINNIFNKQRNFQDTEDFSPITGRFIYLGVRYQWQK